MTRLRITDINAIEQDSNLLTRTASDTDIRLCTNRSSLTDIHAYGVFQQIINTLYWRRLNLVAT